MKLRKLLSMAIAAAIVMANAVVVTMPAASAATVTNVKNETQYSENFDSLGTMGVTATQVDTLPADGWYICNNTGMFTDTTANNPYGYEVAQLMSGGSNNTSNCLRITGGGTSRKGDPWYKYGYGKTFPGVAANAAVSGSWEISFDFRPYLINGNAQFAFSLNQYGGGENNILACLGTDFYMGHNNFNTIRSNSIAQGTLPAASIGALTERNDTNWFNVKVYVNCDAKYYSVELYDYNENTLIARRSPISFVGDTISFIKFSAYNKEQASAVFVDNVSIKQAARETKIYEETFDSFTDDEYTATTGMTTGGASEVITGNSYFEGYTPWRFNSSVGKAYGLKNDETRDSQVVRLGGDGGAEGSGLEYDIVGETLVNSTTEPARGMIKTSFKIKPEKIGGAFSVNVVPRATTYDVTNDSYAFFRIIKEEGAIKMITPNDGRESLNAATWYNVELIFDAVNCAVKTTVTNLATSEQVITFNYGGSGKAPNAVKSILFKADSGSAVLVDDIKIEYYIGALSIDQDGIVLKDNHDEVVTDTNEVTTLLRTIDVPFGYLVNSSTATNATITLKDSSNNTVSYTGSIVEPSGKVGSVYRLTLDGVLEPEAEYTLTIPATVANVFGTPLGSVVTYSFTTSDAILDLMSVSSVSIGGTPVTALNDITASSSIDVDIDYANTTEDTITGNAIMVFYGNGKLIKALTSDSITVGPGSFSNTTKVFNVPSNINMASVDKVSILIWDGFTNITPYCSDTSFVRAQQ